MTRKFKTATISHFGKNRWPRPGPPRFWTTGRLVLRTSALVWSQPSPKGTRRPVVRGGLRRSRDLRAAPSKRCAHRSGGIVRGALALWVAWRSNQHTCANAPGRRAPLHLCASLSPNRATRSGCGPRTTTDYFSRKGQALARFGRSGPDRRPPRATLELEGSLALPPIVRPTFRSRYGCEHLRRVGPIQKAPTQVVLLSEANSGGLRLTREGPADHDLKPTPNVVRVRLAALNFKNLKPARSAF